MENAINQLDLFLKTHRIQKGQPFTHTTKVPSGSYFIDKDKEKNFFTYYCNTIKKGAKPSILENPGMYTPLRVDADFKSNLDAGLKRQYTEDTLKHIIYSYQDEIEKLVDEEEFEDEMLTCIVLEKKAPRNDVTAIKDGFHLHFPFFKTTKTTCEYLRDAVSKLMIENKVWEGINIITEVNKILDINIATKTWLMYGSAKDSKSSPYLITKIYNREFDELLLKDVFKKELKGKPSSPEYYIPLLLSIKNCTKETKLKKRFASLKPVKEKKKRKIVSKRTQEEVMRDIKTIKDGEIIEMLSSERADDYFSWKEVGFVLYNISQGCDEGLELWIDFSKKSIKFTEGVCENQWDRMEVRNMTIGSLFSMAKTDDPDAYKKWKETQIEFLLFRSFAEPRPTEYDLMKVTVLMFGDRFKYTDPKKDEWYEFSNHLWNKMDDAIALKRLMIEEVMGKYSWFKERIKTITTDKVKLEEQTKKCAAIITKLKDITFIEKVSKMCKIFMLDKTFNKKKDTNYDLWPCENGVFNLRTGAFRPGLPDDFCTLSSRQYYNKYHPDDDEVKEFKDLLRKVFPNENRKKYFLFTLCMAMLGSNAHKKFFVCTGGGNNCKTMLFRIIFLVFGDMKSPLDRSTVLQGVSQAGGARADLIATINKRLTAFCEIKKEDKIDIGKIKELSGSDATNQRALYSNEMIEVDPRHTMYAHMNELFPVPAGDAAFWNRIRIILFESLFNNKAPEDEEEQYRLNHFKADPEFINRIGEFAPVFMWYLLDEMMPLYLKEDLKDCDEVMASTNSYRADNDIYLQFVRDKLLKVNIVEDEVDKNVDKKYNGKNLKKLNVKKKESSGRLSKTRISKKIDSLLKENTDTEGMAIKSIQITDTVPYVKLSEAFDNFKEWYSENYPSYTKDRIGKNKFKLECIKKLGPLGPKSAWYGYMIKADEEEPSAADELFKDVKKK